MKLTDVAGVSTPADHCCGGVLPPKVIPEHPTGIVRCRPDRRQKNGALAIYRLIVELRVRKQTDSSRNSASLEFLAA